MSTTIRYSHDALRQLKNFDQATARRIVVKIAEYATQEDLLVHAKALRGRLSGKYRYRIGNYRAIFTVDELGGMTILYVIAVAHRKDIYR